MDNEAYLEHHGVKDQKWGVIRKGYQYSGSSGRSYSTFGSIKTSSKKSYMQKLGSGFIKNIKKSDGWVFVGGGNTIFVQNNLNYRDWETDRKSVV